MMTSGEACAAKRLGRAPESSLPIALEQIMSNSTAGVGLLAQQRYELIDAVAHDDLAILRLLWTGTIARDVGPFRAGQQLRAHIAQFVSTRDGRISKIETYDCYEPFSDGGSER
jgi:hypothetical protein